MRRPLATALISAAVILAVLATGGAAAADQTTPTPTATAAPTPTPTDVSAGVTHAQNPSVPEGAVWTEHYVPTSVPSPEGDPVELHADVLRPAGLPSDARTPVILSVGPYFSHAGAASDEHRPATGPTLRHRALLDEGGILAAGYTVVFADLRGFGGSSGCFDFGGAGDQADIRALVEWAASAGWSTGRVGMYGKSMDATTGLIALGERPAGLSAVVAQEPVWDLYSYLYENGIPAENNRSTVEGYNAIAALRGIDHEGVVDGVVVAPDTARYRENATYDQRHPACASGILSDTLAAQRSAPFWSARSLTALAQGSTVPLFLTQGWLETNTRPDGMADFLDAVDGPVRAWAGPWDHVAGNDVDASGRRQMGRVDWFGEVRAFFDAHLRDGPVSEPSWAVQDNTGRWRVQPTWPGGTRDVTASLNPGQYVDDGRGAAGRDPDEEGDGSLFGTAPRDAQSLGGSQTLSAPVTTATRVSGESRITLRTRGAGVAHARLWDVGTDGVPTLIDEEATVVDASGSTDMRVRDVDWTLEPGHALLVSVGTTDSPAWRPTPSGETVTVEGGTITVPLGSPADDVATESDPAPFLTAYLENARWPVPVGPLVASFTLDPPSATPPPRLAESGNAWTATSALWGAGALAAGGILAAMRAAAHRRRSPR
ncbi:MAG: putative acyl esterase [Microbacterium sp.]|jgi:putative CocE/NonD family hydrolase|nr:putative acyl esterase [Microbacterium sp.]